MAIVPNDFWASAEFDFADLLLREAHELDRRRVEMMLWGLGLRGFNVLPMVLGNYRTVQSYRKLMIIEPTFLQLFDLLNVVFPSY